MIDAGFSIEKQERPGLALPLLLSALLPGSGEQLYNARGRATLFWVTEAVLWTTLWWSYNQRERALTNAYSYAARYASASTSSRSDVALLQAMADYRSRSGNATLSSSPQLGDDYNQEQLRAGNAIDERWPNHPDNSWDWGNPEAMENQDRWDHYKGLVSDYRLYQISFQAIIGGLLLNRLLSLADVLQLHRTGGKQPTARLLPSGTGTGAEILITF